VDLPWPAGAATGVGSLPGTDPVEAARVVAGELPDLPHLAELPARGPGADMLGRTAALLADLYVDLQPSGWRFIPRAGIDQRRALDFLAWDLDALEAALDGYAGLLKVQATGPWTLAAGIELHRGDRALADAGAVRDIAAALAEGVARHVADVRRRVPGATVLVQLDEPSLPAVQQGRIPTASGFGALRAVGAHELLDGLRAVVTGTGAPVGVHCCAGDVPLDLLGRSGAAFVSIDLSLVTTRQYDPLAQLVEDGVHLLLGAVPTAPDDRPVRAAAAPLRTLWRNLSYPPETLAERVVVTPACGLAGASPDTARAALVRAREVARALAEAPEEQ
jgi:methionine synthase II (cobalamin-independent)